MQLRNHDIELAQRLNFLDPKADRQLATELMELHESKCKKCQEDRLSCTVRPACKNRNFLNTLIELGVESHDLPQFCYSVYMDQLGRHILERKGRRMVDRRIPIKDLLATLKVSSIRHFNSKFKKEWKDYVSRTSKDQMVVLGNNMIFHFDFSRGIVLVNPENEPLDNFELLSLYVKALAESFDISAQIGEITRNWWEIRVRLKGDVDSTKLESSLENIPKSIASHAIIKDKDATKVILEIIPRKSDNPLTVKEVYDMFRSFKDLS